MEVCGGHTHSIYKYGIDDLLPDNVELVHGPGCPVCVIPMGRVDDGMAIAREPGVIFTCFGDMMRVPGSDGHACSTRRPRAPTCGWSTRRSTRCGSRSENPDRTVVFFAIGFETTAPSTALTLKRARAEGVEQLPLHVQPRDDRAAAAGAARVARTCASTASSGPGHVSTIVGARPFEFIPADYGKPLVTPASSRSTSSRRSR